MRRFRLNSVNHSRYISPLSLYRHGSTLKQKCIEEELLEDDCVDGTPLHRAAYPEQYTEPPPVDNHKEQLKSDNIRNSPLGLGGIWEEWFGEKKK